MFCPNDHLLILPANVFDRISYFSFRGQTSYISLLLAWFESLKFKTHIKHQLILYLKHHNSARIFKHDPSEH